MEEKKVRAVTVSVDEDRVIAHSATETIIPNELEKQRDNSKEDIEQ